MSLNEIADGIREKLIEELRRRLDKEIKPFSYKKKTAYYVDDINKILDNFLGAELDVKIQYREADEGYE